MSLWKLLTAAYNSSGDNARVRIDASTSSLQSVDYSHHEIHSGSHFFVSGYQDIANGNVLDFSWTMPNTTKWTHWTWQIDCEDEINWFVYENPVLTNPLANAITPLNNNRNSDTVSGTTMKYEVHANLAAANADTDVSGATVMESGLTKAGGFFVPGGGAASRDSEIVLKQNEDYCLRAIANAAGYINFYMGWYEHTDHN